MVVQEVDENRQKDDVAPAPIESRHVGGTVVCMLAWAAPVMGAFCPARLTRCCLTSRMTIGNTRGGMGRVRSTWFTTY